MKKQNTKTFSFITRIKKHAKSTWRILIPVKAIKKLDMRKKVTVTLTQYEKDCDMAGVNSKYELGEI